MNAGAPLGNHCRVIGTHLNSLRTVTLDCKAQLAPDVSITPTLKQDGLR